MSQWKREDDLIARFALDWAPILIDPLKNNPIHPGLGVSGPVDTGNVKLMTQTMVSRVHLEIFNTYYPPIFRNWWSDDWLNAVYLPDSSFHLSCTSQSVQVE